MLALCKALIACERVYVIRVGLNKRNPDLISTSALEGRSLETGWYVEGLV